MIILARGIIEKNEGRVESLEEESAANLGLYSNYTYTKVYEKIKKNEEVMKLRCFGRKRMIDLMELFYSWVKVKKYSRLKVELSKDFFIRVNHLD